MTRLARALLAAAVVLATVGCGATASAEPPKPAGWQRVDLPGDDNKIYTFCDHGNRLYWSESFGTGADGVAVAANDQTCAEGAR